MPEPLYLDHAASTPLDPEVLRTYTEALAHFANPSSQHSLGRRAAEALSDARERVAALAQCPSEAVVFCASATEANHLAVLGHLQKHSHGRVALAATEHASLRDLKDHPWAHGRITMLPVDAGGQVQSSCLEDLAQNLPVSLLSVAAVNHETGILQELPRLRDYCQAHRCLLHSDASQALSSRSLKHLLEAADGVTVSGHKIGAPRGSAALIGFTSQQLSALFRGGSQQGGMRAGTEDVAAAMALGAALERQEAQLETHAAALRDSRDQLQRAILGAFPEVIVHGAEQRRAPGHLCLSFPGLRSQALLEILDMNGLCASAGAACQSQEPKGSAVIFAMTGRSDWAQSSIRFSLGQPLTEEAIKKVLAALKAGHEHLSRIRGSLS